VIEHAICLTSLPRLAPRWRRPAWVQNIFPLY